MEEYGRSLDSRLTRRDLTQVQSALAENSVWLIGIYISVEQVHEGQTLYGYIKI